MSNAGATGLLTGLSQGISQGITDVANVYNIKNSQRQMGLLEQKAGQEKQINDLAIAKARREEDAANILVPLDIFDAGNPASGMANVTPSQKKRILDMASTTINPKTGKPYLVNQNGINFIPQHGIDMFLGSMEKNNKLKKLFNDDAITDLSNDYHTAKAEMMKLREKNPQATIEQVTTDEYGQQTSNVNYDQKLAEAVSRYSSIVKELNERISINRMIEGKDIDKTLNKEELALRAANGDVEAQEALEILKSQEKAATPHYITMTDKTRTQSKEVQYGSPEHQDLVNKGWNVGGLVSSKETKEEKEPKITDAMRKNALTQVNSLMKNGYKLNDKMEMDSKQRALYERVKTTAIEYLKTTNNPIDAANKAWNVVHGYNVPKNNYVPQGDVVNVSPEDHKRYLNGETIIVNGKPMRKRK